MTDEVIRKTHYTTFTYNFPFTSWYPIWTNNVHWTHTDEL